MRKWNEALSVIVVITALLAAVSLTAASLGVFADTWVNGRYQNDGVYVQGHWHSDRNISFNKYWSTKGNTVNKSTPSTLKIV